MTKFLQKIFSIKNINNHKLITLMGIKIKVKSRVNLSKNQILQLNCEIRALKDDVEYCKHGAFASNEFETANTVWMAWGATPELISRLKYLSQSSYQWKIQYNIIWLIYISCLIEIDDKVAAVDILKKYISIYGLKDIERYLPVADFAYKNGYESENIKKASFVFKKLDENRKNKLFEKLIEGKTIAVVGNGPSEIGKGKGKEIDSHDIVIRFNNYRVEGFEQDYGSRTDVWIKCSSDDIKHEIKDDNIELIVYEPDYMHHMVIDGYLDVLNSKDISVDYFDFDDHFVLRKKLNIFPSTGLVAIEKIMSKCNAASVDFYGFSFLQDVQDGYATHYFNDRVEAEARIRSEHHSFDKETMYLKEMLKDWQNLIGNGVQNL